MNSKEFFERVKELDRRVKTMSATLMKLRESVDIKGVNYESIGAKAGSGCSDKMAKGIEKIVDYEKELNEEKERLAVLRIEAEILISSLDDAKEREVLSRMYLRSESVSEICDKMNYSKRRVYEYRKSGLENIIIPDTKR